MSKNLKIAVLNFSGNVGKTTLSKHLLQPRMDGCPIIFVESINVGGNETNIKGKEFSSVMEEVMFQDSCIVDIGSSNIEEVFSKAKLMKGILDGFDYFLVPTVPLEKQQIDTYKLLNQLVAFGVERTKIKVVLNLQDSDSVTETSFQVILNYLSQHGVGIVHAVVHNNDLFSQIGDVSIKDTAAEGVDFRELIKDAPTTADKRKLSKMLVLSKMAQGVEAELDSVFKALFGDV